MQWQNGNRILTPRRGKLDISFVDPNTLCVDSWNLTQFKTGSEPFHTVPLSIYKKTKNNIVLTIFSRKQLKKLFQNIYIITNLKTYKISKNGKIHEERKISTYKIEKCIQRCAKNRKNNNTLTENCKVQAGQKYLLQGTVSLSLSKKYFLRAEWNSSLLRRIFRFSSSIKKTKVYRKGNKRVSVCEEASLTNWTTNWLSLCSDTWSSSRLLVLLTTQISLKSLNRGSETEWAL